MPALPESDLLGSGGPPDVEVLRDPFPDAPPVVLDGAFERQRFSPLVLALLGLVGAFVAYNVAGGLALAAGLLAKVGPNALADPAALERAATTDFSLLFVSNAIGQVVGFGLFVWLLARAHTRRPAALFRLTRVDGPGLALAAVGFVATVPVVQWLAGLTRDLPYPEWLRWLEETEAARNEMIEGALGVGGPGLWLLLLTIAVAPALFEEVLFRGYVQRNVERRMGPAAAILLVGALFGVYHLSPAQALPLAALGVYLAFLTWATGSLWPAVLVHFLNNGLQVVAADYARTHGQSLEAVEAVSVPWYLALASALALGAVAEVLRRRRAAGAAAPASAPAPLPLPSP